MAFSWSVNYVRVGTLILCLHDAADYWLEGAKLARYMNLRTLCDVLFGVFTLNWAVTRLSLYPYMWVWNCHICVRGASVTKQWNPQIYRWMQKKHTNFHMAANFAFSLNFITVNSYILHSVFDPNEKNEIIWNKINQTANLCISMSKNL